MYVLMLLLLSTLTIITFMTKFKKLHKGIQDGVIRHAFVDRTRRDVTSRRNEKTLLLI